jgi:hypothetical protein
MTPMTPMPYEVQELELKEVTGTVWATDGIGHRGHRGPSVRDRPHHPPPSGGTGLRGFPRRSGRGSANIFREFDRGQRAEIFQDHHTPSQPPDAARQSTGGMREFERRLRFLREALGHLAVGRPKRPPTMMRGRIRSTKPAALVKHRADRHSVTSPTFHCFGRLQSVTATVRVTVRIGAKAPESGGCYDVTVPTGSYAAASGIAG